MASKMASHVWWMWYDWKPLAEGPSTGLILVGTRNLCTTWPLKWRYVDGDYGCPLMCSFIAFICNWTIVPCLSHPFKRPWFACNIPSLQSIFRPLDVIRSLTGPSKEFITLTERMEWQEHVCWDWATGVCIHHPEWYKAAERSSTRRIFYDLIFDHTDIL